MFEITFTTPGGVTYKITGLSDGGIQVAAESASYGPHDAFVRLNSNGTNPTVVVQHGADADVQIFPAGAGDQLYPLPG